MINISRKLGLLAGFVLALSGACYTPSASAQVSVGGGITIAPPPPRYEVVPAPRRGWVWIPGYWRWEPYWHRHVWVPGTWVAARPGFRWYPGVWIRHGPNWYWRDGYWGR